MNFEILLPLFSNNISFFTPVIEICTFHCRFRVISVYFPFAARTFSAGKVTRLKLLPFRGQNLLLYVLGHLLIFFEEHGIVAAALGLGTQIR